MFLTAPKNEWCCQEKAYRSLETLKNIGFTTLQDLFDVSNNQAGFYRIYMKLFWIDLVIYTSCLGITLAQPSNISLRSAWRIMQERPMFFSRRYLTWKKTIGEWGTQWSAVLFVYKSRKCHLHWLPQIIA